MEGCRVLVGTLHGGKDGSGSYCDDNGGGGGGDGMMMVWWWQWGW